MARLFEGFASACPNLARGLVEFFFGWDLVENPRRRRTDDRDRAGDPLHVGQAHGAVIAVSGRAVLDPELHGTKAQVHVVRAHHAPDQGVGLIAGLVEAASLHLTINLIPFVAKALGPGLAGTGLALKGPPHGLPGMPNSAHLGGDLQ
jgi:hypothetical protein